ncbi:MAG: UDP-N-acetylmuramoyl-tripeptide--D-alanyl-D-alanine ligase [Chthonomonas sp.]|nr:UDP-N-acetylmuramoyl-tripeptide--D-alanyl-D-alanine ligase [Chthonomonas sp.]
MDDFARRAGATCAGVPGDATFTGFSLDSRSVAPGSLFLCIRGERVDGHDFGPQAIASGATALLTERELPGLPCIVAPSLVEALANFAKSVRAEFGGPVIGITGSNGKTSSKEFVAAALSPLGPVLKNEGNRNTEYTAPLIWAELENHQAVVSEMAMRGFGQIDHLASIAKPTISIITMIGTAHAEMVGSRAGIARAKGEILPHTSDLAIFWREDDFYGDLVAMAKTPVRTFGFSAEADCQILGYQALDWQTSRILVQLGTDRFEFEIPTVGRHQALNAAAALLAAQACGVDPLTACAAMRHVRLPEMRMEPKQIDGVMFLMDNYNASPDSTVAAIRTMNELPAQGRHVAVLGEMRELGNFAESGHRLVGKALVGSRFDQVILFGDSANWIEDEAVNLGFPAELITRAVDLNEIRERLLLLSEGDVVLIKGSRALGLEEALPGASTK